MQTAIQFTNTLTKPQEQPIHTTDPSDILSASTPSSIEEQSDDQENQPNDLTLELKSREVVYVPRDWVAEKLHQIKTFSSLSVNTFVLPRTIQTVKNVLSMDIQTENEAHATFQLHFFQNGIVKLNCINPVNPSQFSFEMIEKPANLVPYDLTDSVKIEEDQVIVTMSEAKVKILVAFSPFRVIFISTKDNSEEVLFEMNKNNSLKFDSNITADFTFSTEYLYGLPERACNLLLEDTKSSLPYRFYNQDTPAYPIGSRNSLYSTVPIMIGRRKDSSTMTSLYWQNTSDTYVDIHRTGASTQAYWLSERGNLECYIFVSHLNIAHYKAMSDVFGHSAMPQHFSLGYHQSRWSYKNQQDVLEVNEKFNEHEIPYDSITLDIDHTDGCRYFTWNEELFPNPVAMQNQLVQDGRQLITIADPHIKVDDNYHIYREAIRRGLVVKNETNETFVGKCWPGESIYLDFLNEETRNYWASQYSDEKYDKSTPNVWAWNDMNEPSVFEMPGNHMPLENLQIFKTISEPEKAFQVEHREVHNIYGYLQHKATYEGLLKRNKDQKTRPHVLTRSFYAGSQKWATVWTGDTAATWEYLKITVPQMLSLSLCGISNCGGDVGGFIGDPEPELAVRWYQLGAFMPYFRGHSAMETKRREPWLYEKQYSDLIKHSIKMRYRLLAYWYTCFAKHCKTAIPILRPVWFDQVNVLEEGNMYDQERFMVGDGLLVIPIMEKGKSSIMKPIIGLEGRWYDYFSKKEILQEDEEIKTGLERIGCFVKGGKIIPTFDIKSDAKSTKDAKESSISLYVALDENENAEGEIYFDDGETFDYKEGQYAQKKIKFERNILSWEGAEKEDNYSVDNEVTKVFIMGASGSVFQNAYLEEDGKVTQKVNLVKELDYVTLEFRALANKNWRIILD